jgi:hypothetical protein
MTRMKNNKINKVGSCSHQHTLARLVLLQYLVSISPYHTTKNVYICSDSAILGQRVSPRQATLHHGLSPAPAPPPFIGAHPDSSYKLTPPRSQQQYKSTWTNIIVDQAHHTIGQSLQTLPVHCNRCPSQLLYSIRFLRTSSPKADSLSSQANKGLFNSICYNHLTSSGLLSPSAFNVHMYIYLNRASPSWVVPILSRTRF